MKKLLLACTALAVLAFTPAKADTFLATDYNVIGGQSVVVSGPVVNPINTQAGEIHLTGLGGTFMDVWCLDVFDTIQKPYDYTISTLNAGDVRPGVGPLSLAQIQQITSLMLLGNSSNTGPFADAVIQLAIWNAEYGSSFHTLGLDSGTQASVNTALADTVFGGIDFRTDLTLTVLTDAPSDPSQAFGQVTLAAPVPEPSTWAMMIIGFAGIVFMGARKRREGGAAFRLV
jgi:PEP-CTERM motif